MLTLGTQRDLTNDMLIKGIIDSVVTVNQFYNMLPFKGIQGNALAYNREKINKDQIALVDGGVSTAFSGINKSEQEFDRHNAELTTIIGDAQINGLIQAVGSDYNDATAVQVAAKAKGIGRSFMNLLINGQKNVGTVFVGLSDTALNTEVKWLAVVNAGSLFTDITSTQAKATGTAAHAVTVEGVPFTGPFYGSSADTLTLAGLRLANYVSRVNASSGSSAARTDSQKGSGFSQFDGMENFVINSNNYLEASTGTTGIARLGYLDQLIDRVHDKDGMVDYLMMNSAGVRKITQAFRDVGTGFDMMDVKTSSGGVMQVQSYRGVPIFRNDFIAHGGTLSNAGLNGGDGDDSAMVYAGTIDDGSFTHGICGLTASKSAGMQVQKIGAMEDRDSDITRVKWYCGLAHFSELGLVRGHMA